ncbi:MAG: ribonuclease P protein component [Flavobacteriaceae bacterium]|jgi:ribonuclease P protein component|nr:ribonuclease P protein component [Flavobacteriaceae bacterium]
MNQKYTKEEHLKGDTVIKYLFEKGFWANKYPLKIIYCAQTKTPSCHKTGVSVSKKNFKRAVDRNRIKRLLRECYRLHKKELYDIFPDPHLFMIIYAGKEILSFQELEEKYLKLLGKIKNSDN